MAHRKDLPFLLSLLDDSSHEVRTHVREALKRFGNELLPLSAPYLSSLDDTQAALFEELCQEAIEQDGGIDWLAWFDIEDQKEALEYALIQLAGFESGANAQHIRFQLDDLAQEYLDRGGMRQAGELMEYLFLEKGFSAPLTQENEFPYHNLCRVLDEKRGSQLALSCLAILVGRRVGISLDGIDIQGNFMAISFEQQGMQMYNSFNQGKPLARASAMFIEESFRRNAVMPNNLKAQVYEIVGQVLKAGIEAYHETGKHTDAHEYVLLYKSLEIEVRARGL